MKKIMVRVYDATNDCDVWQEITPARAEELRSRGVDIVTVPAPRDGVPDLAPYDGHEWRAAVEITSSVVTDDDGTVRHVEARRASSTMVICAECGITCKIGEWPAERCKVRLAPVDWQPQKK